MIYEKNQYYHIYNRGCNKEKIFRDKTDYEKLMFYIRTSKFNDYFELFAFSLMTNHYHFFLKQISDKPVYKWFQYIFNRYVQYFNKKYQRTGTIFEGSIKPKIINNQEYFGLIAHYIHSNPSNEIQEEYSSLKMLYDNSLIDQDFYYEHFESIEKYLLSFQEYLKLKNNNDIDKYLFEE